MKKGEIDDVVAERTHNCTGFPYEVMSQDKDNTGEDPRRRCYLCDSKTRWKCIKCRFYFCMSCKPNNNRDELYYFNQEKENIDSTEEATIIYGKSCFHIAHEPAICNSLKDNQTT